MIYGVSKRSHLVHRCYNSTMGSSHCGVVKVANLTMAAGPRAIAEHLRQFPDTMCRTCFAAGVIPKEVRDHMQPES